MAVHDWSLLEPDAFHSFRLSWIAGLSRWLNTEVLSDDFYSCLERPWRPVENVVAGVDESSQLLNSQSSETEWSQDERARWYASVADRIVVRSSANDSARVVIEICSPGTWLGEPGRRHREHLQFLGHGVTVVDINLFSIPASHIEADSKAGGIVGRAGGRHTSGRCHVNQLVGTRSTGWKSSRFHLSEVIPDVRVELSSGNTVLLPINQSYLDAWSGEPEIVTRRLVTSGV